jgi:signal transduction histidine kinase
MRLHRDWCEVPALLEAAVVAVPTQGERISMDVGSLRPVWVDHDRLQQVVVNLLDNAVRHGGGSARVRAYLAGEDLVIDVADDGPGIPAPLRETVLDAYVRGDTGGPGAGLGLAICKGIVEAHGGRLCVVDTVAGALLRVTLPLDSDQEVDG